MLGQEVLRVAGCDIGLFDCLYFRPYAAIGSYHTAAIPFLKGDTALRAARCAILSTRLATIVSSYTGLEVQSTIDSFTERTSDAAAYAAGIVPKSGVDDFTDEGDAVPASPPPSARAATVADSVAVAALAEAALPHYISVVGGLCQTPPVDPPQGVRPLSRATIPFPSWEDGLVLLDLFSGVGTTLLSLLRTGAKL